MALTPVGGKIGFLTEEELPPQTATVPSVRSATLCDPPAATAVTLVALGGTLVWPERLSPQATTPPSSSSASTCPPPALITFTSVRPAGTLACPLPFNPHTAMLSRWRTVTDVT